MLADRFAAALLHNVVRALVTELGIEASHRLLALQLFALHENPNRKGFEQLSARDLQAVADWLYRLDEEERIVASCYSVSLTLDLMAYAQGDSPELVMGLKKTDEKLLGHAWLRLSSGAIINPGRQSLEGMVVMKRLLFLDVVKKWAMGGCLSG